MAASILADRFCGIGGYEALARIFAMALSCWLTWAQCAH
jgi:hypothetical protein